MTGDMKRVCLACGKVEGEHRGWDVSCHVNSQEFPEEFLVRDPETTLVTDIKYPRGVAWEKAQS